MYKGNCKLALGRRGVPCPSKTKNLALNRKSWCLFFGFSSAHHFQRSTIYYMTMCCCKRR